MLKDLTKTIIFLKNPSMTLPQTMSQVRKFQKTPYVFNKKNVETYCWHQKSVTYLLHKQFSSSLHPYKVYLTKPIFPFYKLIHVSIKDHSFNCNFLFYFLKYVETSYKWVLLHLAPLHQNHKHFVSGEARKTKLLEQPRFVIDVIQDAKTNLDHFT